MAFITADRVKDTSATVGTGAIIVSGSAPTGYRTLSTVLSNGDTFYYCVQGQTSPEWEVGTGTYTGTNTFSRTTVIASSNSNTLVPFSAGQKNVFLTLAAAKTIQSDTSGVVTLDTLHLTNPLTVPYGGTGASTLTGYVKGNGTGAFTATATIPGTAVTAAGSNTQIQYNSAGAFAGSSNFVFDGTNVGIGTSSPSAAAKLTLAGTPTNSALLVYNNTAAANTGFFGSVAAILGTGTSNDLAIGAFGSSNMTFYTSANERMRIDANGNLTVTNVPATVGTNNRSLGNRFAELFNVFDFLTAAQITSIQTGGGGTDATLHANINTALATARANNSYGVYFPPGIYNLSGRLYFGEAGSISMVGAGPRQTILNFTNATAGAAGINLAMQQGPVSPPYSYLANVKGFTVRTTLSVSPYLNANTALQITFPTQSTAVTSNITIENVEIDGGATDACCWTGGMYFNYGYQSSILNCNIRGRNGDVPITGGVISTNNMLNAIELNGSGGVQGSNETTVEACSIVYCQTAVAIDSDTEGTKVDNSSFIAVNKAIVWVGGGAHPSIRAINSHFATYQTGIELGGVSQISAIGNLFYKRDDSNANWTGVYVGTVSAVGTSFSVFSNNIFNGQNGVAPGGTSSAFGISAVSSSNIISNNIAFLVTQFADLSSSVVPNVNYFFNNVLYAGTQWLANKGTSAIMVDNQPLNMGSDPGYNLLTANSTTPTVGSANGNTFYTQNSTAKTITDFVDSYVGQTLNIIAADSNTTVKHNAGMILKGGVDFVMAIGNTLTLVRATASVWRELSRTA